MFFLLAVLAVPAKQTFAQTGTGESDLSPDGKAQKSVDNRNAASNVAHGVIVEQIEKNSEAEKAGLQPGDVLLHWVRGDAQGDIESPFDLAGVETEQAPRGTVTLKGLRGTVKQSWAMGGDRWKVMARPQLAESLLLIYEEGRELEKAAKATAAAERWRAAAIEARSDPCPWLSSWFLLQAAELSAAKQQWKEADATYAEAIEQAKQSGPEIKAQLLRAWAAICYQRSEWTSAEKYYRESIAENRKLSDESLGIARSLNELGLIAGILGDLAQAGKYHQQALDIRQKLAPGSLDVARSLNNVGNIIYTRGELAQAEKYYQQALDIRQKLAPGSLDVARSLIGLGNVAHGRGDLAQAEKYYQRVLDIEQKLAPRSFDITIILTILGIVAEEQGDLAQAEKYHEQALDIEQEIAPGNLNVARSLNYLGHIAQTRGDLARAEKQFQQALEIQQKLAPESLDFAFTLSNLGLVASERGDLVQAEKQFRHALEIKQKLNPMSLDLAASFNDLGNVAVDRGDLTQAEKRSQQALDIQQKLAPGSLDFALTLRNLGLVATDRRDLAQAEEYFRHALEIRQKLNPMSLDVATSFNDLGNVAVDRGDLVQAKEWFRQALDIRQKLTPESLDAAATLQSLGDLAREGSDLAKAEEYYHQALTIREKLAPGSTAQAESLAALASILYRKQQSDAAALLYEQAVTALESQTARLGGSAEARSSFRASHSHIYRDYIDLLLMQKQPERAFEILERSRTRILLEMLAAAHVDIRQGADPSLLEQEHSLQELLTAKSDRRLRLLGEKNSEKKLVVFIQEIEDLEKQYQEVEERLRLNSPGYAALTQPQPLSAREIQQLLDSDSVLFEYLLGEKRSYLWTVTPNSVNSYELPSRSVIEAAARKVYELLTARNRIFKGETDQERDHRLAKAEAEYPAAAAALSNMVLVPAAMQLTGKRLVVVSDGALQYLPFSLLPSPDQIGNRLTAGKTDHTQFTPLIAEHEVVNLPSASVLAVLRGEIAGRKPAPKTVAVLADPVFELNDTRVASAQFRQKGSGRQDAKHTASSSQNSGEQNNSTVASLKSASPETSSPVGNLTRSAVDVGLSTDGNLHLTRLPSSRREAKAILSTVPAGQGMEALDFKASRITATGPELAQYRIVHIATHGLLDSEHPELSGLVLSLVDEHGKQQNGFLELQDIYNLNLPVDMVVLSACETGLGKEIDGEGLIGLTRGFMYAGAPRVVASLWKVDDAATAELMSRFYKAMVRDGLRPAAALRRAQVEMWKQERWASPFNWAGFQMQGEWK